MINQIQINNFRNYENIRFEVNKNIIILYGENGQGKTNILEAISLFSLGKGLRKAKFEDIIRKDSNKEFWNIIIHTEEDTFSSGYLNEKGKGKRIFKVSDKLTKNLTEFAKNNYILWMTYETDRLFIQSPSDRRDFIDMFCSCVFIDHAVTLLNYEKTARERQKILKEFFENGERQDISRWLYIIEEKIAKLGIEIATNRIKMVEQLELCQLRNGKFPEFKNTMTGKLEDGIINFVGDTIENYRSELASRRQKDYFTKTTTFGPNRSDWRVIHAGNCMDASLCSAGEQKMLLSGVFLAFINDNLKRDKRNLILLLDDVIAHLDANHRSLLFEYLKNIINDNLKKISIWLSGTEKSLFDELKDDALFFRVDNNAVERG